MVKSATKRLNQALVIVISLLFFISLCTYFAFKNQVKSREDVANSRSIISLANRLVLNLKSAEISQANFKLTHDEYSLTTYNENIEEISFILKDIRFYINENSARLSSLDSVERAINQRKDILEHSTVEDIAGNSFSKDIREGKLDGFNTLISDFISQETTELENRSERLAVDSLLTIISIVIGVLLSLLIVFYLYNRLKSEILERDSLQELLKQKDAVITNRIHSTQALAQKIADGNYDVRVKDEWDDDLNSLTLSLNEMASSLEKAFTSINDNNWKQSGIAKLSTVLHGNIKQEDIASFAISHLIEYCNCVNGAFYVYDFGLLRLKASYGLESYMKEFFHIGEGLVGQVYLDHKLKRISNSETPLYTASCSSGDIRINHVVVLPLISDNECIGVIELGSVEEFTELKIDFLEQSSVIIALELFSAISRMQVQELLEETQAKSEELRSQHTELEALNIMLESHAKQLQASEEELRVQQEELMLTNQQLEEKNGIVAFRNYEIQKNAEELAASTKYKSEFLANMSHELRTPLNSILLLSRLMLENLEGNLTERQLESVKVILSSGSSLLHLIDEILDLSKIEAGKMKLEYEWVSLSSIVNDLEDMFKPVVSEKGLDFAIEIDANTPVNIYIDKLRLEQVLRNLLSNAIKFTTIGHVKLKIFLDQNDAERIHFVVEDTGIGIDKDNLKIIFHAFQQADGSTKRKFEGTGLGLSISREIGQMFEGELTVESELNVGSSFRLVIPIARNSQDLHSSDIESADSVKEQVESETGYLAEKFCDDRYDLLDADKSILIVADDVNLSNNILSLVRGNNYKGIVIDKGEHVLDAVELYKPIAIVLDIRLSILGENRLIDSLKLNENTNRIPVYVLSVSDMKVESFLQVDLDFAHRPIVLEELNDLFDKIEEVVVGGEKKVLIIEEETRHAAALADFLNSNLISTGISDSIKVVVEALLANQANCVVLDMRVANTKGFEALQAIKATKGLERVPIIIFTGKDLSNFEKARIKEYTNSKVVKIADSFQVILDEVGLFLNVVKANDQGDTILTKGHLKEVLKGKTLLLVDDDMRNIFSISRILEQYSINVIAATNGKEALEKLETNTEISIVLMDIMMPEMDGYECMKRIKAIDKHKDLPIIAVTAKAMTGDKERCFDAGASDYISKPVDKDQLISLLRVWLCDY